MQLEKEGSKSQFLVILIFEEFSYFSFVDFVYYDSQSD